MVRYQVQSTVDPFGTFCTVPLISSSTRFPPGTVAIINQSISMDYSSPDSHSFGKTLGNLHRIPRKLRKNGSAK